MGREFKEILAGFLKDRKLSPQAFAATVGVGKSSVRVWLKGNAKPSFLSLKKICLVFLISSAYFLGITDEKKKIQR